MAAENRHVALAERLILAHLTDKELAYDVAAEEITVTGSWRGVAEYLNAVAAGLRETR